MSLIHWQSTTCPRVPPWARFALGLLAAPAFGQAPPPAGALPPELQALLEKMQPKWNVSADAHAAAGYKDNLLLSHTHPEASGFVRAGFSLLAMHLPRFPDGRIDYFASAQAEGTRFFSPQSVDHEADAFTWEEWRYRDGDVFKFALDAKGFYRDHVYDFSDTDLQRTAAPIKVYGAIVGPTLHWAPRPWCWVEAAATGERDSYRDGFNNSDLGEGALRVGWKRGKRVELSVGATARRRAYDSREQYSVGGRALTGTLLRIDEREGEARLAVAWDAAAHWKTVTRAFTLRYADNGSGYFSYHQRKVKQEFEWTSDRWTVSLDGSARRLDFDVQTVGIGLAPPARVKEEFAVQARIERKLNDRWTIFGEYSWERSRCNDPIASYRMNEGLLGATWSWEK